MRPPSTEGELLAVETGLELGAYRKLRDHVDAAFRHDDAIEAGTRQPRYFHHARPGIEETRGVAFAPKPKTSRH